MGRTSTLIGLLLVILGALFLLSQLHLLPAADTMLRPGVLWPLVLALIGLTGLRRLGRGKFPLWSLFLVVLGALLALRNSGAVPIVQIGAWDIFWALFLIFAGFSLILPRRFRGPKWFFISDRHGKRRGNGIASSWGDWNVPKAATTKMVGDLILGSKPWTLSDRNIWNAIGDVRVNLSTAHIEDGVYHLRIGGWIGDVRVLVPTGLDVSVNAAVALGDLTVFDDNQSGTGRRITHADPGFAEALKKVVIDIDLKIGDVQVVRV